MGLGNVESPKGVSGAHLLVELFETLLVIDTACEFFLTYD
jgi:hypothetical protein